MWVRVFLVARVTVELVSVVLGLWRSCSWVMMLKKQSSVLTQQHVVLWWSCKIRQSAIAAVVDCIWNVMAHTQKPDFIFRRNGLVRLNRRGQQFNRLLAAEVCASAVVMLDTPSSGVVWRVLATHSICHFPLHFPSCMSPCGITFQLDSN